MKKTDRHEKSEKMRCDIYNLLWVYEKATYSLVMKLSRNMFIENEVYNIVKYITINFMCQALMNHDQKKGLYCVKMESVVRKYGCIEG